MLRLTLFAKCPLPGHVKTRLCPPLTRQQAAALHEAFVTDQLGMLAGFSGRCELELCADGSWVPPNPPAGLRVTRQGPGDLGARLERHFAGGTARGLEGTVVVGADAPTLPAGIVAAALAALAGGAPAAVSPAADGGYTLIAMRSPLALLLREIPWGGPRVLETTVERAREAGIELRLLEGWYDVDDAPALKRLAAELAQPAALARAPATAAALRLLDSATESML